MSRFSWLLVPRSWIRKFGIAAAIWLGAQPWRLRDFLAWLFARPGRARVLGAGLTAYGVLLAGVAFTY